MVYYGFFEHQSANGTPFWRRIERFYSTAVARHRWVVGENLAWHTVPFDAEKIVDMWLASPSHRRIVYGPEWVEVGIAAREAARAPGVYSGLDVVVITADFGVRL